MKYVIRRRSDDKYYTDLIDYAPQWSKKLSEALKLNIDSKDNLSVILSILKDCGYDENDLLVYTVINPF